MGVLSVDSSTAATTDSNPITVATVTPPSASLLLALAIGVGNSGTETLTIASAGRTWTLLSRSNASAGATIEAWTTPVAASATFDIDVTDDKGAVYKRIKPVFITDSSGGIPGTGATRQVDNGNPIQLTSTAIGSIMFGQGIAGSGSTAEPGQTIIDQDNAAGGANVYQAFQLTAPSTSIGQILDIVLSLTMFDINGVEIVPSTTPPPPTGDGGPSMHIFTRRRRRHYEWSIPRRV